MVSNNSATINQISQQRPPINDALNPEQRRYVQKLINSYLTTKNTNQRRFYLGEILKVSEKDYLHLIGKLPRN